MKKIKLSKRLMLIILLNFIFLIIGLLYPSIIDKSIISAKLTTYIDNLVHSNYTLDSLIKTNASNNLLENTFLYLFTYFTFTFPLALFIYILKIFILGVSISSIIYIYKFKGLLYLFITVFPSILNLIVLSVSFYYSLSYFIIRVKYKNKVPKKRLLKSYLKIFIITSILEIIITFLDSYLSFYFFKLFS